MNLLDGKRNFVLDFMKVICCILVVFIHMPDLWPSFVKIAGRSMAAVGVPCFMSISGYLVFFRKEYEYKELMRNIFLKYLIIFLFWWLIYVVYQYMLVDRSGEFLKFAVTNSEGWHLWYLKVYLQILLVYPLIRAITCNEWTTKLFSVLWFFFIAVRYTLGCVPGITYEMLRAIQLPFFQYSGYIGGTIAGYYPMECLGIFVTGGYCIKCIEDHQLLGRFSKKTIVIAMLATYSFTSAITYIIMRIDENKFGYGVNPFQFFVFVQTISFIGGAYIIAELIYGKSIMYMIEKLSDLTMGVYIIHPMVKDILMKFLGRVIRGGMPQIFFYMF